MDKKIELELDQDKRIQIDIISKAFSVTPGDFIKLAIENEIGFIKSTFEHNNVKNDLETYYGFEIDVNELKKLILVEVI